MARTPDPTAKISLLRAAEEVFAEHGLAAAKVEEITRRAGHSKGAFYLHFQTKEDAFKQVVESFLARCRAMFVPPGELDVVPSSPEEMVAFWLERDTEMFEMFWQNRAIVAILATCQGPYTYLIEAFRDGVQKTCREWIELSKARGLLRPDLDAELVTTLLCGAYHELSHKMLALPRKPPIAQWLRQSLSIFLCGLGTPQIIDAVAKGEILTDQGVKNGDQNELKSKRPSRRSSRVAGAGA
jgi:AcrR family transcriptional regulator